MTQCPGAGLWGNGVQGAASSPGRAQHGCAVVPAQSCSVICCVPAWPVAHRAFHDRDSQVSLFFQTLELSVRAGSLVNAFSSVPMSSRACQRKGDCLKFNFVL